MRSRLLYASIGIGVLLLILGGIMRYYYTHSIYVTDSSYIHIGAWGSGGAYVLSLSTTGSTHAIQLYKNDKQITIPGGLKTYRIGALSKLARLEGDRLLIKKALSQASKLPLDKVIYEDTDTVYYSSDDMQSKDVRELTAKIADVIWMSGDLNVFDKLFLSRQLQSLRPSNTTVYTNTPPEALFYDKTYRNEKKLVQMLYSGSLTSTSFMSTLLENIGIRVADLTHIDEPYETCIIREQTPTHSRTAHYLATYFGCDMTVGSTGLYEIQFVLGRRVEEAWRL